PANRARSNRWRHQPVTLRRTSASSSSSGHPERTTCLFSGTIVLVEQVATQISRRRRSARVRNGSRRLWRSCSWDRAHYAKPKSCAGSSCSSRALGAESESRQTLRAVVGDLDACDLLKRTVWLGGVAHQFRSISIDLVEIGAIWRNPAIARATANHSINSSESSISRDLRARGVLRDREHAAVDAVAADVAVTEVRREHPAVIRGDGEPAQFRGHAGARVEGYWHTDGDFAVSVNLADRDSVANGISDDEGIWPVVQE